MSNQRNFKAVMQRVGAAGILAAIVAGCATASSRGYLPDGRYCFRQASMRVCTASPAPDLEQEARLKRFPSVPDGLTLWVVRNAYADSTGRVPLLVGDSRIESLPHSFSRVVLAQGEHTITLGKQNDSASLRVEGSAGEQVFVELVADAGFFSKRYHLQRIDAAAGRQKALTSKLIGDVRVLAKL